MKLAHCLLVVAALVAAPASAADDPLDRLRTTFPPSSIDSAAKADDALAATKGAKAHVEHDYKAASRACLKAFLVNDCLNEARDAAL